MTNRTDDRRRFFENATSLTQDVLDEASLYGLINIAPVAYVGKFDIYISDRPIEEQYNFDTVPNYYEGRASFSPIVRTLGELLNPSVQLSSATFKLANIDGYYNNLLETGADYVSPIGAYMSMSIVLSHNIQDGNRINNFIGSTYKDEPLTVDKDSITLRGQDRLGFLDVPITLPVINATDFPSAPADSLGKVIPFVLGDWEEGYNVNTNSSSVSIGSDLAQVDSPDNFYGGVIGYNVGGGNFVFSIGSYTPDNISYAHIKRGDLLLAVNFNPVPASTAGYWSIQISSIKKSGGGTIAYTYQSGDLAVIGVKVPYASGEYSNIVRIAKEMIITLGTFFSIGDFDSTSWDHFETKSSPSEAAIANLESRMWIGDNNETVLKKVLGLLEQARLEMFIQFPNVGSALILSSLHPDEWAAPGDDFSIDQFDIDENSIEVRTDDRTFFNKASMNYAFTPVTMKTERAAAVTYNQNSIDLSEKEVFKIIDCPNLYTDDAQTQLGEFVRLFSSGLSFTTLRCSWVHMKRELGSVGGLTFRIGSIDYDNVPVLIRDATIDPSTGAVTLKCLNLATFPYQNYTPANAGQCLSAYDQTLTIDI